MLFATASVNASNTIFSGTFLSSSTPRIALRSCVYLISMISPYNLIANLAKRILFFSIVAVRFTALSRYSNAIVSALTEAVAKAFKKDSELQDIEVKAEINKKSKTIDIYQYYNVVEEVEDDELEISLEDD